MSQATSYREKKRVQVRMPSVLVANAPTTVLHFGSSKSRSCKAVQTRRFRYRSSNEINIQFERQ
ncbi:hypothetical protein AbraIFM66951_001762 [Aspergillus brasiliensis]|nr:hypothetical protein AbraIFM66951_001762 [Aspergillus brasiliensis]